VVPSQRGFEKTLFLVGLISAVAVLAVIAAPMLSGETYFLNDLGDYDVPLLAFYQRCLAGGDSFAWCPDIFCGYYLAGEGQVGMYHPLHLLLYRTLPLVTAFNLEVILTYPFMLVGMYLFLRRWQVRRDAALFGAILFTFSGFNLLHFIHVNPVATVAHIPWLLFAIDVLARGQSRSRRAAAAAGIALLTGSQLLLAYPQAVMFSMAAEGGYLAMLSARRQRGRLVGLFFAAKVVGFGLGAVQLLPMIDAFGYSTRVDTSVQNRMVYSLERTDFVQLVAPYLLADRTMSGSTHENGLYAGAAAVVLLAWLAVNLGRLGPKRPLALAAILLMLLALDAACGPNGVLVLWLTKLPLVNMFRVPGRYIVLVHLGMAVAGAIALDAMARAAEEKKKTTWRRLWPIAIPAFVAVAAAALALWPWENPGTGLSIFAAHAAKNRYFILAGPVLVVTAACLVGAASRAASSRAAVLALAGIIVFAAGDQALYGLSYIRSGPVETIPAFVSSVDMPPEAGTMRVASGETTNDKWLLGGYRLVYGYVALPPRRELDYSTTPALRLAEAKWRWGKAPGGGEESASVWSEVPDPLPRARLVSKAVAWKTVDAQMAGVDVATTAVVEGDIDLPDSAPGEAAVTVDRPGHIVVSVAAPGRQILVVSESFHPGWRATSDGAGIEVIPVYGDFMGCVVEPGKHVVELTFKPLSLAAGMWVSIIALVVLPIFVIIAARRT
jgi:hypothetical protein